MEHADRAGFAGYRNWAEDHVEGDFTAHLAINRALSEAGDAEEGEILDEEWFEDDLLSLIQNRPSRHTRHN